MTQRQIRTAAAYLFGDRRSRPTQKEVGRAFGIKQPAVCRRLSRFEKSLPKLQRNRYLRMKSHGRHKTRVRAMQLNFADTV